MNIARSLSNAKGITLELEDIFEKDAKKLEQICRRKGILRRAYWDRSYFVIELRNNKDGTQYNDLTREIGLILRNF